MKVTEKKLDNLLVGYDQLNEIQIKYFFNLLKATVARSRARMTATFLTVQHIEEFSQEDVKQIEEEMTLYLGSKIRQTDFLFKLSDAFEWCILFTQSGEEEAAAFLTRLFRDIGNLENPLLKTFNISMAASVAEIGNSQVEYEQLIESGRKSLSDSREADEWSIEYLAEFKRKDEETVRISVLEDNEIVSNALYTSLEELSIENFNLEIKLFKDGYEFLESDYYHSGHRHIVIMNDILPKKNGLEVLHTLRKLPNEKKYIILMMTKRNSEADMLRAYEKGVDEYLIKPFNLRLFEAQIKRIFGRLWS